MMRITWVAALLLMLLAWPLASANGPRNPNVVGGRVVDAGTGAPLPDAILTVGDKEWRSNAHGAFSIDVAAADAVRVRADGYARTDVPVNVIRAPNADVRLKAFHAKALYLSMYGVGDKTLRSNALKLLEATELNALVIDVKGDRGLVPYRSAIALVAEVGAQRVMTIGDLPQLVAQLHDRGIYTIARIVVFKDNLLSVARPSLALHARDGAVFRDREKLAWTNPYSHDVWAYNIGIAVEAARAGFDEIQFDYVRFPDTTGLVYDLPWTELNRESAIDGFLTQARAALVPFNVFLAADTFGYICWNRDDTKIGQKLEHLAAIVDYVSPMLYPSGFQFGIPGYRKAVEHPYEIVRLSLDQGQRRTRMSPVHFRPWLQAFRDYSGSGRPFTAGEVRLQIKAAEDFGAGGWMLWNSRNQYSSADLKP
jgi:hypothetical protein